MASHNTKKIQTRSYRFSGYQLKRDLNNNIIGQNDLSLQLNTLINRAISLPDNVHIIKEVPRAKKSNQFE